MASSIGHVSNLVGIYSTDNKAAAFGSEFVVLVCTGTPPSQYNRTSELAALVSKHEAKVVAKCTELAMLVSYAAEGVEKFNQRSWGFNFDQHQFYVLHLGVEGTLVYDVLTQQWAQWQTQGYIQWNAEAGIEWEGEVYFGDAQLPTLWRLDPDSFLDEDFRLIQRVVTGGIPAEARETLRSGMFVLSATKQATIDDESTPYVQLSISDDGGFVYKDRDQIVLNDSETQDFSWRGLGTIKAPGRVFKITDEGGFITIKGANQSLYGEDEGDN